MNYLNDIWKELLPMINWVIFVLVIGSGYFIRATPILKKISTTEEVVEFDTLKLRLRCFASLIAGFYLK